MFAFLEDSDMNRIGRNIWDWSEMGQGPISHIFRGSLITTWNKDVLKHYLPPESPSALLATNLRHKESDSVKLHQVQKRCRPEYIYNDKQK